MALRSIAIDEAEQSEQPPAYIKGNDILITRQNKDEMSKMSLKYTKFILCYAGIITLALIVLLAIGGISSYRSMELIADSSKKYHDTYDIGGKLKASVEIDVEREVLEVYLQGDNIEPGTFGVMDYSKSMVGFYDAKVRKCYLIGGIESKMEDPQTLKNFYEKNATRTGKLQEIEYRVSDSYPVGDKSILPQRLATACQNLPVYWLQPAVNKASSTELGRQRREVCYLITVCDCCTCYVALVC